MKAERIAKIVLNYMFSKGEANRFVIPANDLCDKLSTSHCGDKLRIVYRSREFLIDPETLLAYGLNEILNLNKVEDTLQILSHGYLSGQHQKGQRFVKRESLRIYSDSQEPESESESESESVQLSRLDKFMLELARASAQTQVDSMQLASMFNPIIPDCSIPDKHVQEWVSLCDEAQAEFNKDKVKRDWLGIPADWKLELLDDGFIIQVDANLEQVKAWYSSSTIESLNFEGLTHSQSGSGFDVTVLQLARFKVTWPVQKRAM